MTPFLLLLLVLLLKTLAVFAVSGLALLTLRRASASARHLVCLLTLAALLALPLFSLTLPGWRLPVLRQEAPLAPNNGGTGKEVVGAGLAPALDPGPPAPNHGGAEKKPVGVLLAAPSGFSSGLTPPLLGAGGLLALYALGVLLALVRPLLGLRGIAHLRRLCVPVTDPPTLALADDCAALLGLKRQPLLCRAAVPVPMTWGWRRPVVLLPLESFDWPTDRTQAVLLHEMAHIKRRDWLSHRLADLVCAVYWFHPFVWLTARRLRAEGEIACDDLVLASGIAAPDYARHLLDIARALPSTSCSIPSAIAMAQTSQIEGRLHMILDKTQSRRTLTRRVLIAALAFGAVVLVPLAILRPTAKAQVTIPLSAASPGGVGEIPDHGLDFTYSTINASRSAGGEMNSVVSPDLKFNGTTLFAGVTDANKPGSPWWSASGTLLPTPVYDTSIYQSENHVPANKRSVIFAFRLPATAQGATLQYEMPQSIQSSSDGAWTGKTRDNAGLTEAQQFTHTNGTRVVTAEYPASLSKANIRVGIGSGPWKMTVSEMETPGALEPFGGTGTAVYGSTFILAAPVETANGLVLMVSTNSTRDIRVVAIDKQGNELFPNSVGSTGVDILKQITAHFSQPITQIKVFRVETRPFQWVEFKDIALHPTQ